jgi:hypothetical protein
MGLQESGGVHSKYRKRALYGENRRQMGEMFCALAKQKKSQVFDGHPIPDHVHRLIAIPPKPLGRTGDRVHQGEEHDSLGPNVLRPETELRRTGFLGTRLLRVQVR